MKVDLRTLLKVNGNTLDVHLKSSDQDFQKLNLQVEEIQGFELKGILVNASSVLKFKGKISFSYKKNCDRCLEIVESKVENELEECFYSERNQMKDIDYFYFEKSLDFTKFIIDQIIMSFPTIHICSENCKGICPKCGVHLNHNECTCKFEDVDPRLSKFKDLITHFESSKEK